MWCKDRSWSLLFQYFWLEWQEEWWSLLGESLNLLLYTLPGRGKPSSVNIPSSAPHLTHSSLKRTGWLWQVWIHFSELDKVTLLKDLSLWSLYSFISLWDPSKQSSSICLSDQTQIFPLSLFSWQFQDLDLTLWKGVRQGTLASPFGHTLTKSFYLDFICDKCPSCLIHVSVPHLVPKWAVN